MRTRDVMTTYVVVVFPDMAARDAARLLAERGFTALPVVDTAGALVGVVMTKPVTATQSTDLMLQHGVRSVPVVHEGRLVGIVTRRDMIGSSHRWTVEVTGGRVSIVDTMNDATDRHVAEVLARAVAGVTDVRFALPMGKEVVEQVQELPR